MVVNGAVVAAAAAEHIGTATARSPQVHLRPFDLHTRVSIVRGRSGGGRMDGGFYMCVCTYIFCWCKRMCTDVCVCVCECRNALGHFGERRESRVHRDSNGTRTDGVYTCTPTTTSTLGGGDGDNDDDDTASNWISLECLCCTLLWYILYYILVFSVLCMSCILCLTEGCVVLTYYT